MIISTGQVASLLKVSTPTAAKVGACGLLGENLGTQARPKWDWATAAALADRPVAPRSIPNELLLVVSMGRPTMSHGRAVGWHEDRTEDEKREAVAGVWQAPADITGLIAVVAIIVVGAWRVTGSALDADGFATYQLASPRSADALNRFVGTRFPSAMQGPSKWLLRP